MLDLTLADAGANMPGSWLAFSPGAWVSAWTMWPWRPWPLRWSRPRNMPWPVRSRCDSLHGGRPRTCYNTTDHDRFNQWNWYMNISKLVWHIMINHSGFGQTQLFCTFWNPKWRAGWWLRALIGSSWFLELSNPGIQLFALAQGALFLLGGVLGQRRPVWMWMRVLRSFGFQMCVRVRQPGPYFAKCQSRQSG